MTLISLFAGIGGFDLGFQRAGVKTVATVEIDANCRKLLKAKWPDAVHLDDVRTSGRHNLPECDIVTFGFPCQDLSVAGKRAGLEGKRSGLFYEAMRIIDELQPAWAVWENVPGLLSSDNGRDLARVLFRMGESGYFGCVRCLDAQWFGVAQRRRRLFGVFTRLDSGAERCAEILSLQESLRGHPAPSREAGKGFASGVAPCAEVSGILDRKSCGANRGSQANEAEVIAIADVVHGDKACNGKGWNADGIAYTLDCMATQGVAVPEIAGTLKACGGKSGGWSNSVDHAAAGYMVPYVARTVSCNGARGGIPSTDGLDGCLIPAVAGCLPNDTGVHPCLRSDSSTGDGAPYAASGMSVRRLTPTECERLQGFSDNHTSGFSDSVRYKMLGNAVCVNVAEWIAKRMVSVRQNMNGEDKA
jgi:DNA (cytosine-5)-methyltransferase 1